ncbi:hypothetical protein ACH5RR_012750 [Cinchona calisaya]|uniref:Peptidase A2 domain-containing protein n=1 Tax=Cinchona calisaya TaxID=153742 RepID=A0ABD3AA41_9GENT
MVVLDFSADFPVNMPAMGSGNTLSKMMDRQEHAFLDMIDRLGELPVGYNMLQDLRELNVSFTVLKSHVTITSGLKNAMDVMAMMDTGATHSFVTGREVQRVKLDLKENGYHIKAVNSEAQPVFGLATVELTLGSWVGQCKLMAISLDDFDLFLR